MARNEEKHFCNLNRLILLKEKEEYEKTHPQRPRLNTLDTPEDIQKWLPSIKRDIDFYLKKSQVTCYSDAHVEECREKVVKLEKEFKAFVRKIKQLAPSPLDVIPWTSRPYKRKNSVKTVDTTYKEFKRIATPILDDEESKSLSGTKEDIIAVPIMDSEGNNTISAQKLNNISQYDRVNWDLMDLPLHFSSASTYPKKCDRISETNVNMNDSNLDFKHNEFENSEENQTVETKSVKMKVPLFSKPSEYLNVNQTKLNNKIVSYDSSDDENS